VAIYSLATFFWSWHGTSSQHVQQITEASVVILMGILSFASWDTIPTTEESAEF
jgi:hypothetical protein